ncbi:MAG: hypothetical protein ABIQ31_11045 [Ferruginibacter sp.]
MTLSSYLAAKIKTEKIDVENYRKRNIFKYDMFTASFDNLTKNKFIRPLTTLAVLLVILSSCKSVARISDFSATAADIDFNKYSAEYKGDNVPSWMAETSSEYYFEIGKLLDEKDLSDIIHYALKQKRYAISKSDAANDCIIGKRGMVANEWSSITGVYYKLNGGENRMQVYVKTKITQDFTGGWKENRAKKVGQLIEQTIIAFGN